MKKIEIAKIITDTIHDVLSKSANLKSTRCLHTTTLVMHFFERCGIEARLWQGTAHWYSRKYVELMDAGHTLQSLTEGKDEQSKAKRIEALKRKGIRTVSCIANDQFDAGQLGGHIALAAKVDDTHFFIDPTAYQFRRIQKQHGFIVNAPDVLYCELFPHEYEKPEILFYKSDDAAARYIYQPLETFSQMHLNPNYADFSKDLDPKRYTEEYNQIENLVISKLEEHVDKVAS